MTVPPLPVTVVSGYLGAGKTTLINRLLAEDHGLSLMVMVNDFGAINIDAELIRNASGDTIELTNGCVCCTMGADLFMALGDALDRRPRPDHLVIEASGIADPARIANTALAEPELHYAGIVTVVEPRMFADLENDPMIGAQYRQQIASGDLVILRKGEADDADVPNRLRALTQGRILSEELPGHLAPLLLDLAGCGVPLPAAGRHPDYLHWEARSGGPADLGALEQALGKRPPGILRLKGFVRANDGTSWEVQAVGSRVAVSSAGGREKTRLVALGVRGALDDAELSHWWSKTCLRVTSV